MLQSVKEQFAELVVPCKREAEKAEVEAGKSFRSLLNCSIREKKIGWEDP